MDTKSALAAPSRTEMLPRPQAPTQRRILAYKNVTLLPTLHLSALHSSSSAQSTSSNRWKPNHPRLISEDGCAVLLYTRSSDDKGFAYRVFVAWERVKQPINSERVQIHSTTLFGRH